MNSKSLTVVLFVFVAVNSLFAQETKIKSGDKYFNREIISRILDKKVSTSNEAKKAEGKENISYFGSYDIFGEDKSASFTISLKEAVEMSLHNNIALNIEKIDPEIYFENIESAKSEFDNTFTAEISSSDRRSETMNQAGRINSSSNNSTTASIGVKGKSKSGVKAGISASVTRTRVSNPSSLYAARVGIDVTAPLKQGAGREINLVTLKKAELDLDWSKYELYGYILDFVHETEKIYWTYYLSVEQLEIVKESLNLALRQREETKKRIGVGKIAESELAAADAEVALCQVDLIDAESNVVTSALSLLRCINQDTENFWRKRPNLNNIPKIREIDQYDFSLEDCIADAMVLRPELRQAELLQRKNQLEIVAGKDAMLPKLDFFISLGKTGYAEAFKGSEPSFNHRKPFDASIGLTYELSQHRRAGRAKLNKANLNLKLQKESIKNLEQVIKEEVIKSYIEIKRAKEQLAATAATAQKQEEKLRVENVKFDVGKTTAFQVAQVQRDFTATKLAQVKATIAYTLAKSGLLRSTGLLLKFRGIEVF